MNKVTRAFYCCARAERVQNNNIQYSNNFSFIFHNIVHRRLVVRPENTRAILK